MVKVSELEDGDLERIQEAKQMLAEGKTEDSLKSHFEERGFIPYHIQFIIDIAAGRIPLEEEMDENLRARAATEKKHRRQNTIIALLVGGVVLAVIAGAVYFHMLGVN